MAGSSKKETTDKAITDLPEKVVLPAKAEDVRGGRGIDHIQAMIASSSSENAKGK